MPRVFTKIWENNARDETFCTASASIKRKLQQAGQRWLGKKTKAYKLNKSINNEESIYFIEYTKDIPVGTNINDYIGQSNYINVGLIGVPTLMEISDHVITNIFVGSKEIIKTLLFFLLKCTEFK